MTTGTNPNPVQGPALMVPALHAAAVTPSDANELTSYCKAFRVGTTAGNVQVTTVGGETLVVPGVQIGETIRLQCKQIWSTNTAATGITAFW